MLDCAVATSLKQWGAHNAFSFSKCWHSKHVYAITAGTYFQLGDYLYMTTADKSSGAGALAFQPPLRATIASGQACDFTLPKSLWRMASNDVGWSINEASIYGFSFSCVEAL